MLISVLKSKISYARVTGKNLHYIGSITIDKDIIKKAGLRVNEQVHIVNINNGERLVTYVIEGKPGKGQFEINGPAARLAEIGDEIFILAYGQIEETQPTPKPKLIHLKEGIEC